MATRTVSVDLVANVGQYQSAMVRAAATTKSVGDTATSAGAKAQRGFDMAGRGAALLGGALAGGVAIGLKRTVDLAANAEQSIGGVEAVFKQFAQTVIADSQAADRALGLSANSYRELATVIGSQLKNAGVPMEELAAQTDDLITMGADLAAMFGGTTEEAVRALSSALKGEMDPIEAYGISLNDAALKAEAAALGLEVLGGTLSVQQRTMAVMSLVTKQGADAVGAFGRESDTAAGRAARASAQWENLQTAIGEKLLPAWSALMDFVGNSVIPGLETVGGVLSDVGGFFADNTGLALALGAALAVQLAGGLAAVNVALSRFIVTPAVLGLSGLLGVVLNLPGALAAAGAAVGGFVTAIAPLAAVTAVVYGIAKLVDFATAAGDAREEIDEMWEAVDDVPAADRLGALEDMAEALRAKIALLRGEVEEGLDWGSMFSFGIETAGGLESLGEFESALADLELEILEARGVVPLLGDAFDLIGHRATEAAEETAAASEDWLKSLQSINEGFVQVLPTYQGLLGEAEEMIRNYAQVAAENTTDATDSWEDYVYEAKVSLEELAAALATQLENQANWRSNLAQIAQWAGADVAQYLAEMGEDGIAIVAEMADGTTAGAQDMREQILRVIQQGGSEWTTAMDQEMQTMALIGRDGSARTVQEVARQLGVGVGVIREIARKYGVELASGVNPLLRGLGKPGINISDYSYNSGGGRADGGFIDGYSPHPRADNILTPLTAGEHVQPVKRVRQYGGDLFEAFRFGRIDVRAARSLLHPGRADGGFISSGDVPRPPSTAPYRSPISPPADETMNRAYGDTVDWVNANSAPPPSALATGSPGQWQAMFAAVQRQFPYVQLHSGFRPGSITATGNLSYHALGRAIDITPDVGIFNWLASNYPGSRELIFSPMNTRQIWNGSPHYYSEPTRGDHWDHIHWAMANGGVIGEPVIGRGMWSGGSYSFGERGPETVVPGIRSREFSGASGGGTVAAPVVLNVASARVSGRATMDASGIVHIVDGRIDELVFAGTADGLSARGVHV